MATDQGCKQEGEWNEVTRKNKRIAQAPNGRMDIATTTKWNKQQDTISFYFSEFPETHGAKAMLKAFQLYGEAIEVVISSRRNKWGRRFGFVRFKNVRNPGIFAVRLDNIIIGARKIHVNLPRFQRSINENAQKNKNEGKMMQSAYGHQKRDVLKTKDQAIWRRVEPENAGNTSGKQTYAKAVKNNKEGFNPVEPRVVYYRKNNITKTNYNASEEEMDKCKKMYVGEVKTPGSTHYVQEWFSMQGFFSIKITPLGANKVLMEEMEEGMIQDLLSDAREWIYEKFKDIRRWSQAEVDNERVVWVRCHGIPVHAWNNGFFELLASKFGVLLGVDEDTRKRSSMEVARLRIRSKSYDVFNMVVNAKINGSMYNIKVVEEWCGPLHWICNSMANEEDDSSKCSVEESEEEDDDGPPLFTALDDGQGSSGDEVEVEETPEFKNIENYEAYFVVQETFDKNEKNKSSVMMNDQVGDNVELEKEVCGEAQNNYASGGEIRGVHRNIMHAHNYEEGVGVGLDSGVCGEVQNNYAGVGEIRGVHKKFDNVNDNVVGSVENVLVGSIEGGGITN